MKQNESSREEEIKGREGNRMVETEGRRRGGVEKEGEEGRESRRVPLTTMRLECKPKFSKTTLPTKQLLNSTVLIPT